MTDGGPVVAQYDELARWYDPLYEATGKDHAAEAEALLAYARDLVGEVTTLLDVACGTGLHLAAFGAHVHHIEGADLSPAMVAIARERLPGVPFSVVDFRTMDLGRRFDVVTCLFSAIGHVADADELDAAIERMAAHVAPGGALLVEPWLTPDAVITPARSPEGHRSMDTATTADGVVARVVRSVLDGDVLDLTFGWAAAHAAGVTTAQDHFRMPLFTRDRYLQAVEAAGLAPSWNRLDALFAGRGLLVGRREE